MTLEKRTLTSPVEVRKAEDKRTVAGYAALFNSEADIAAHFAKSSRLGPFLAHWRAISAHWLTMTAGA